VLIKNLFQRTHSDKKNNKKTANTHMHTVERCRSNLETVEKIRSEVNSHWPWAVDVVMVPAKTQTIANQPTAGLILAVQFKQNS